MTINPGSVCSQEEDLSGTLHISYSQINSYLLCPAKYAHQYVWGTPWESKPAALAFGSAIHKAAESYYRILQETGEVLPSDELVAVFESVLDSEKEGSDLDWSFKNGDDFQSLKILGAQLLEIFRAEIRPQHVLAVEYPFLIGIPDLSNPEVELPVKLAGVFDLVEHDEETCVVGELKTSSQRFSSLKLEYDLQPTVYSYAMKQLGLSKSPESCLVRFDVLLKAKKPSFERYFVTRTQGDHQRLVELINQVLWAIENRLFYRNTGWMCGDCQFKKTCFSA